MLAIRWVTWWPAPYWNDRFTCLAKYPEIDLEVYFLNAGTSIQEWVINERAFGFKHTTISSKIDTSGYFKFQFQLPRFLPIVSGKYDVLIMPYADTSCITAAIIRMLTGKRYFIFVANTRYDIRTLSMIKEYTKKVIFSNATGILATGPDQKEYALQYVSDEKKISVIGNPSQNMGDLVTLLTKRETLRREFNWKHRVVLLFVGRLSEEKGLFVLLDALLKTYKEGIKPILVVVGSGPLEKVLRQEVATQKLYTVMFTGFLQKMEVAKYYAAADIFILSSKSEPWGLVVNEAMEFGLPLILSDRIGCRPVLLQEEGNGLSFPCGDSDKLASCIKRLYVNAELRRQMGKLSKSIVKKQSVRIWAETVYSEIKSYLNKRKNIGFDSEN